MRYVLILLLAILALSVACSSGELPTNTLAPSPSDGANTWPLPSWEKAHSIWPTTPYALERVPTDQLVSPLPQPNVPGVDIGEIPSRLLGNMSYSLTFADSSDVNEMDMVRVVATVLQVYHHGQEWSVVFDVGSPYTNYTFTVSSLSDLSAIKVGQPYDAIAQFRSNRGLFADGTIDDLMVPSRVVWNLISIQPTDKALPPIPYGQEGS